MIAVGAVLLVAVAGRASLGHIAAWEIVVMAAVSAAALVLMRLGQLERRRIIRARRRRDLVREIERARR